MGGLLFKNRNTSRLDKEEYLFLQDEITKRLNRSSLQYRTIKFYKSKSTFGDLDILVEDKNDKTITKINKSLSNFNIVDSFIKGPV